VDPEVQTSQNFINGSTLCDAPQTDAENLIKMQILNADQEKQDQLQICAIKECHRGSLLSVASNFLSCDYFKFTDLSEEEQNLWSLFDN
jgi:hypothetical protein